MSNKGLIGALLAIVVIALVAWGAIVMFDVDVTDAGRLPDVDVNVEGGELPEAHIEGPDIQIEQKEVDVPVPDVSIERKDITLPTVDVKTPEEKATGVDQ